MARSSPRIGSSVTDTSFESRLQRIVREVLDTRVDLLAIMMSEARIDPQTTRESLVRLVHGLRNPIIEPTIFEAGRRMPMKVEGDRIVFNAELLERVGDEEVLTALARPVAEITAPGPTELGALVQYDVPITSSIVIRSVITIVSIPPGPTTVRPTVYVPTLL